MTTISTTISMRLLGPASFRRGDRPVDLTAAKAVGILGYLAVTRTPQSRERLADLFWPESLEDAARKNLRNTLWAIRRELGEEVLRDDTERVALGAAVGTDIEAFEEVAGRLDDAVPPGPDRLQEAADLYRAPLLDGLSVTDAPEFEIWLSTERERLGQQYLRLLDALVAAHRDAGNWQHVISVARRALQHDNLQEPMYRALMEAHARLGERAEALRQYEVLRNTLSRELGVQPLPETEALREQVRAGDVQPHSASTPVPATSVPARRQMQAPTSMAVPFVGREQERAVLDEELQRAAAGEPRIALLTGELGIGKSRLWEEWSRNVPSEMTILETRCLDTTQTLPFAPLTNLFTRRICQERLFSPPSPIPPVWLAELARLLPEIKQAFTDLSAPSTLPPEEERRRLFEAFTQALRAIDSRPLILFIDDLHWVDRATLDWLVYLADRMRGDSILLVGAYRPTDAPARLARVVAQWSRQNIVRRLPLERLRVDETSALLTALGIDEERVEELQAKSTGNPYFLIELSRAAPEDTPPALVELVRARLDQLPESARQVLQAAAVLDADFDFATLRRTSGRGEEETLDALDALLDAAVLREDNGSYEFTHPLVATVVRHNLSLARRSFLHRRAAEALESTHAGRLASMAGQLSQHYQHAGRPVRAAEYAEMAAERALALAAPAEAVELYRTAQTLAPTPQRRIGLGEALLLQGELDAAREAFQAAREEYLANDDTMGAARAALTLANSFLPSGRGDLVLQWVEEALPHLDARRDPEAGAQAHHLLGAGKLLLDTALTEVEGHLVEAVRLARENELPAEAAASRFELGNLFAQQGDLDRAVAAFEETIRLAERAGDRFQALLGHNNLAYHALLAGDLDTATTHIDHGLRLAEDYSLFLPRQYLYSTRGEIALAQGELDAADGWFERALAEAERFDNQTHAANIRANQGLVARERGDLDAALLELEAAHRISTDASSPHLQLKIDLWLTELHLARGETTAATEALERATARLAGSEREGLKAWAERLRTQLS